MYPQKQLVDLYECAEQIFTVRRKDFSEPA